MTSPYARYAWHRLGGIWDAGAVVADPPAEAVPAPAAERSWPFGDADVAVEACVLDALAALTSVHGPWDAANRRFNPIDEGDRR